MYLQISLFSVLKEKSNNFSEKQTNKQKTLSDLKNLKNMAYVPSGDWEWDILLYMPDLVILWE